MGIQIRTRGSFKYTEKFFKNIQMLNSKKMKILERYGSEGVSVLSANTPVDTGKTAASWSYRIIETKSGTGISWYNSNESNGIPIVILLHYGHGTKSGRYIQGIDFINPSLKPIFDRMSEELWKEVVD